MVIDFLLGVVVFNWISHFKPHITVSFSPPCLPVSGIGCFLVLLCVLSDSGSCCSAQGAF